MQRREGRKEREKRETLRRVFESRMGGLEPIKIIKRNNDREGGRTTKMKNLKNVSNEEIKIK